MTPPGRRPAAASIAAALLVLLTACGIPLQSTAEPLPANAIPAPLRVPSAPTTESPSPTASGSAEPTASRLRLWFVQEDGLAAAESTLVVGTAPDLVVQSLAVGPTAEQAAGGLRTVARDPLTGLPLVTVAASTPSPTASPGSAASPGGTASSATGPPANPPTAAAAAVTVQLSPAFSALPPVEQVLLLGQVVLSLTGSGEASVSFTDEAGSPAAVPLPDGRLLAVPATARDYASLIVRP